jgi:hypothetical protein
MTTSFDMREHGGQCASVKVELLKKRGIECGEITMLCFVLPLVQMKIEKAVGAARGWGREEQGIERSVQRDGGLYASLGKGVFASAHRRGEEYTGEG